MWYRFVFSFFSEHLKFSSNSLKKKHKYFQILHYGVTIPSMFFFSNLKIIQLDASPVSLTVLRILLFFRSTLDGWDKMPVWLALLLVNAARITILGDNVDPEQEKDLYKADTLLVRCIESKISNYLFGVLQLCALLNYFLIRFLNG